MVDKFNPLWYNISIVKERKEKTMIDYARIAQMIDNFNAQFSMLTKECDNKCKHCAFGVLLQDNKWHCIHDVLYDIQNVC